MLYPSIITRSYAMQLLGLFAMLIFNACAGTRSAKLTSQDRGNQQPYVASMEDAHFGLKQRESSQDTSLKVIKSHHLSGGDISKIAQNSLRGSIKTNLETKLGKEQTQVFTKFLTFPADSKLEKLNFSGSEISSEDIQYFSEALGKNTSLKSLSLRCTNIDRSGTITDWPNNYVWTKQTTKYLSEALKKNTNLEMLNLSANNISDEDIRCLSEALKENTSLQKLNLSANNISDKGMQHLAEALKVNTSLQVIYLDYNNIVGNESLKFLTEALKYNTSLQKIRLNYNYIIDAEVLKILIGGLQERFQKDTNTKLKICLKFNDSQGFLLSKKTKKEILDYLKETLNSLPTSHWLHITNTYTKEEIINSLPSENGLYIMI